MSLTVAIRILTRAGEVVVPTGLGCYRVNGEVMQPAQIIAYAQDLGRG